MTVPAVTSILAMILRTTSRDATAAPRKGAPNSVWNPLSQTLHKRNNGNQPFAQVVAIRSASSESPHTGISIKLQGLTQCSRRGFRHRHQASHNCNRNLVVGAETTKNSKNELARSLLAKHFPTPTSKVSSPSSSSQVRPGKIPSSDPAKLALAQKVQAMKMRQRAIPGDPKDKTTVVPLDQKLHVQVKLEGKNTASVLWFRKVNGPLHVTHSAAEVE